MKNTINDSLEKIIVNSNNKIDSLNILNKTYCDSLSAYNHVEIASDNNQILGISIELARILIPVIVTISIFTIGQILIWIKTKKERQKEIETYRHIILTWIDLIEKGIIKQVSACKDFSNRLSISENILPERLEYNLLLADKVDDFAIDIYIKTFVLNTKGSNDKEEWCFTLILNFTFLKEIEKNIKTTYEKYQRDTLKIMNDWNTAFTKFDNILAEQTKLYNSTKLDYLYSEFHIKIMRVSNDWLANLPNKRSSQKNSMGNLISPLSVIVNEELKNSPSNDYAFHLSACIRDLRIIDMTWQAHLSYKDVFNNFADQINDAFTTLKSTQKNINNFTTIKSIFTIQ